MQNKDKKQCANALLGIGPGQVCVLFSQPSGGKTTTCSTIALACTGERDFLGYPTTRVNPKKENKVLFFNLDLDSHTFKNEFFAFAKEGAESSLSCTSEGLEQVCDRTRMISGVKNGFQAKDDLDKTIDVLRRHVLRFDANVIIFDSLFPWLSRLGLTNLTSKEAVDAVRAIKLLAKELQVCFVLTAVPLENYGKYILGNPLFNDAVDHIIWIGECKKDRERRVYTNSYVSLDGGTKPISQYYFKVLKSNNYDVGVKDTVFYNLTRCVPEIVERKLARKRLRSEYLSSDETVYTGARLDLVAVCKKAKYSQKYLVDFDKDGCYISEELKTDIAKEK